MTETRDRAGRKLGCQADVLDRIPFFYHNGHYQHCDDYLQETGGRSRCVWCGCKVRLSGALFFPEDGSALFA